MPLIRSALAAFVALAPVAASAIVEIDQSAALAGAVTPGDSPGFPVTIDRSGSYRLVGNLTTLTSVSAVEILADEVQLDLAGFSIHCEGVCASGHGVDAGGRAGVAVRNGFIHGFGGHGVFTGPRARIEALQTTDNGRYGLRLKGSGCIVRHTIATGNARGGIRTGNCVLQENVSSINGGDGIRTGQSTVTANVAVSNDADGIVLGGGTARSNVSSSNAGAGIHFRGDGVAIANAAQGNLSFQLLAPPNLGDIAIFCEERLSYARNSLADGNTVGNSACTIQTAPNLCSSNTTCP